MGAAGAKEELLRRDELEELEKLSGFDRGQILDLYVRFRKLDTAGQGAITRADLLRIPELSTNPLVDRVVAHFGFKEASRINFADFLRLLAVFRPPVQQHESDLRRRFRFHSTSVSSAGSTPGGAADEDRVPMDPVEERWRILYSIFDTTGDGFVTKDEVFQVLKSMVGSSMSDQELGVIVQGIMGELDVGLDGQGPQGRVSFSAFSKCLAPLGLADQVVLSSWRSASDGADDDSAPRRPQLMM